MSHLINDAKWIWYKDITTENQHVDFRVPFSIKSKEKTFLHISSHSHYSVFVNDKPIYTAQYPDFETYKIFDSIDISSYVECGDNILTICGYCQNIDSFSCVKSTPGILFVVENDGAIIKKSDTHIKCRRSLDYFTGPMEKISMQVGFSIRYDAAKYDNWRCADYDDSAWDYSILTGVSYPLFPRPIKQLDVKENKQVFLSAQGVFIDKLSSYAPCGDRVAKAALSHCYPSEIRTPDTLSMYLPDQNGIEFKTEQDVDGMYFLVDFEKNETGYASIDIETDEETEILIAWGEHLNNLRVHCGGGNQFCFVYKTRKGRQQFVFPYRRIAGLYMQVHVYSKNFKLYYAGLRPTPYPVELLPKPYLPDALHERIYDVGVHTLHMCMHEHYEDCPMREQAFWLMDSEIQMLCGYYAFKDLNFATASLRLVSHSLRDDGLLEMCVPARAGGTIPCYSLFFIFGVYENVLRSNDISFAREMLPTADKILETFLGRLGDNGLISSLPHYWNFYEWSDGMDGNPAFDESVSVYELPLNALMVKALVNCARLHEMCGSEQSIKYLHCAEKIKSAMQLFWDEEQGLFVSRLDITDKTHELSQALAVWCGACDDKQTKKVLDLLSGKTENNLIPITLSCYYFKCEALLENQNEYDDYIKQEIIDIWSEMLFDGAKTFWEVSDAKRGAFGGAASLCHGWSSIPVYIYGKYGNRIFGNCK